MLLQNTFQTAFFLLLFFVGPVPSLSAQALPYDKKMTRTVREQFQDTHDLYFNLGDYAPGISAVKLNRKRVALREYFKYNFKKVATCDPVYNIMAAMLAAEGVYGKGADEFACFLNEGRTSYLDEMENVNDGGLYLQWLKEEFGIDMSLFDRVYDSPYAKKHQVTPSTICCRSDPDEDGVCDKADKCPREFGLAKYHGCPCPDDDRDGICNDDDQCPTVPGLPENYGCPCTDTDKDGICDADDACPKKAGPENNQGCPLDKNECLYTMEVLGGIICITEEGAVFTKGDVRLQRSSMDILLLEMIGKQYMGTDGILLEQAIGTPLEKEFEGSQFILLKLRFIDEYRRTVILFKGGEYVIRKEKHPSFFDNFTEDFAGVIRMMEILGDTLAMPVGSWALMVQGMADNALLPRKPLDASGHLKMINGTKYFRYDAAAEEFIKLDWQLAEPFIENPQLPNSRGAWLLDKLRKNPKVYRHAPFMIAMSGFVTDEFNPEHRNATIYLAIDRQTLKSSCHELEEKLRARAKR